MPGNVDIDTGNENRRTTILHASEHMLEERFRITHTTVQMECADCINGPIIKEMNHQPTVYLLWQSF